MRGIFAGSSDTACARTRSGAADARTNTTVTMAERICTRTKLLCIRHLCAKQRARGTKAKAWMFIGNPRLASTVGHVPYTCWVLLTASLTDSDRLHTSKENGVPL